MDKLLIKSFYKAEDYFFRSLSKECVDFDDLTTAYLSGVSLGSDNPVYIRKNIATINTILHHCAHFYKANHVPWDVIVTEQFISQDLEQALNELRFGFIGKSVAMYLELDNSESNINKDFNIQSSSDNLQQWLIPLSGAFELTHEVMQQYADAHKWALSNKRDFHHYTLFKDDMPISSLTLSLQSNVARISDVGTMPAYQGRGYATHLVKYAINEATNLRASYCFLEASEAGISVYQKRGFKPLFKNNTYSVV